MRANFTGGELNNRIIGISPLLTEDGPVSEKKISSLVINDTLRKVRPELKFQTIGRTGETNPDVAVNDLPDFYRILYQGKMLQLQNSDSLWHVLGSDYLLVLYLRYGLSVITFNSAWRKRVRIEAELWDCNQPEVVWRASADGWCNQKNVSDIQFVSYGIGRLVTGLPALMPSYDNQPW